MDLPELDKLSLREASEIREWLTNVNLGKAIVPKDFNWLGLADRAAFKARQLGNFNKNNLIWAKIAVEIYEKLARDNGGQECLQRSAMMLKTYLIIQVGSDVDPDFLNVARIVDWFFDNLKITYDEVLKRIEYWQKSAKSTEEMPDYVNNLRLLRKIKTRLKVIALLADYNKISINQELNNWLSLMEKLP